MKYGENYNRIDGSIIMGWLREYNKERCATADNQSWNEHKAHRAELQKPTTGMFYGDYRRELERKASSGDETAKNALQLSDGIIAKLAVKKYEKQRKILEEFYKKQEK